MRFNFDEIIDRRGTNSMKWDQGAQRLTREQFEADPLPMWVADMDFRIAPAISQALHGMIDMGVFGYGGTTAACAEAVIDWHARRFGWKPSLAPEPDTCRILITNDSHAQLKKTSTRDWTPNHSLSETSGR